MLETIELTKSYNVRETLHACDRVYILSEGKILKAGPPEKIVRSKKVRKLYLGEKLMLMNSGDTVAQDDPVRGLNHEK